MSTCTCIVFEVGALVSFDVSANLGVKLMRDL